MDASEAPEGTGRPAYTFTNRVLAAFAILSVGVSLYGTKINHQLSVRLGNQIGSVKVPVPGATLIAMEYDRMAMGLLIALGAVCVIASWRREARAETLSLNVATIGLALGWWAFHSAAHYLFTVSLFETIRSPR